LPTTLRRPPRVPGELREIQLKRVRFVQRESLMAREILPQECGQVAVNLDCVEGSGVCRQQTSCEGAASGADLD